jgi:hypothetical protein
MVSPHVNGEIEEPVSNNAFKQTKYDVFLGGTRNSQGNWREEIAIPALQKYNISYTSTSTNGYVVLDNKNVTDQDVLDWKQAMDSSQVLLFYVTADTRSLTTMILAAHYIAVEKDMVLCIQPLPEENCVVGNETVSFGIGTEFGWIVIVCCFFFNSCQIRPSKTTIEGECT